MAARRPSRPSRRAAGAAAGAAASASASAAAAPEPSATTFMSGGLQPVVAVDKLADFIEETHANDDSIAWEKTVHQLQIAGVTVTVTGSLYAILSYVNTYITTANISALISALASAFGTYASVISAWLTANPHVIILLLLASVLGATIEPITVAIAARSTRDPALRAIRVEAVKKATTLMRTPGNAAYDAVRSLFEKISASAAVRAAAAPAMEYGTMKASEAASAISSAATAAASAMGSGAASAASYVAAAAGSGVSYAQEFLVGSPEIVKRREDILTLRRAIYIWAEALQTAKEDSTVFERIVRDNANYLLGQIVTLMGRTGLTDEELEEYIGVSLPGVTGKVAEMSAAAARSARALSRWFTKVSGSTVDLTKWAAGYVFHGKLAETARTGVISPLTEVAEEVDSMVRDLKSIGIVPPGKSIFLDKQPGETVRAIKRGRDEDPSEPVAKRVAGSAGRHTVRKHKKRSKSSRHRRKTVSHRRGKRTHHRRRTNRRTTKRSKK